MTKRRKNRIFTVLILCVCLAFWWVIQPSDVRQTGKETGAAVSKLEMAIKSQDKAVERIVTDARGEVAVNNEKIQKDVSALDGNAVAGELMALVEQYRRERGD